MNRCKEAKKQLSLVECINAPILNRALLRWAETQPTLSHKKSFAFTLAEIIIVVGIIGVVAQFTIPNLVKNYQKNQTATKLEKVYSVLNQAYKMSEVENGESVNWSPPAATATAAKEWWGTYLIPYLSTIKSCTGANTTECWSGNTKWLDNNTFSASSSYLFIVLKDGVTIYFDQVYSTYAITYIDLNGLSKPNKVGIDIFRVDVMYKNGYILMAGKGISKDDILQNAAYGCNKLTGGVKKGLYCGGLIQQDGWQIKDDYPWD